MFISSFLKKKLISLDYKRAFEYPQSLNTTIKFMRCALPAHVNVKTSNGPNHSKCKRLCGNYR